MEDHASEPVNEKGKQAWSGQKPQQPPHGLEPNLAQSKVLTLFRSERQGGTEPQKTSLEPAEAVPGVEGKTPSPSQRQHALRKMQLGPFTKAAALNGTDFQWMEQPDLRRRHQRGPHSWTGVRAATSTTAN